MNRVSRNMVKIIFCLNVANLYIFFVIACLQDATLSCIFSTALYCLLQPQNDENKSELTTKLYFITFFKPIIICFYP